MGFRFIKQHDAMQCGVASLAMVCSYLGKRYSAEYLSQVCYATHKGVSSLSIAQAAKKIGLVCLCAKTTVEGILQAPLPCILHWNQNHFVVLVLDGGKVVETGNHASLIAKQGTYYNLVKNQLELGN